MQKKILKTTPNELGSGNLPSGYDKVIYNLDNGNWTKNIFLPTEPTNGNVVIIKSSAIYKAELDIAKVDLPLAVLKIYNGCEYIFDFHAEQKKWRVSGSDIKNTTPNQSGDTIYESENIVTLYSLSNGNWVPEIILPAKAKDNALIIIRSKAIYLSKVSHQNMLFASTTKIMADDEYIFKYLAGFNGWVVDSAPQRMVSARGSTFEIPSPTSQNTIVLLNNTDKIDNVKLPQTASDRDKISLQSSAVYTSQIDPSNVNNPGIMQLYTGEQYDFFYIAENEKWQLMQHPDTYLQAKNLTNGIIPALTRPRTFIEASDGNWLPVLTLPAEHQEGSRVIVTSHAQWSFKVQADDESHTISTGETVAFKVDAKCRWKKETRTIDLLIVYSEKAAEKLGENVVRNRLNEAFNLTNEALENSGANFRFRMRGLEKIKPKDSWKTLGDPLSDLRSDPIVQGLRDKLKADGVYYEGTEEGCGLAWVKSSAFNMIATGSINCGTTVMRHELGHNMGLHHAGESNSYNQGYGLMRTIMGGNSIPYYSTPHRYSSDYGIPLGIPDKIDAVRAMNEFSSTVAAYR